MVLNSSIYYQNIAPDNSPLNWKALTFYNEHKPMIMDQGHASYVLRWWFSERRQKLPTCIFR